MHLQPPEPKQPGVPSRAISFAKVTRSSACWSEWRYTAVELAGGTRVSSVPSSPREKGMSLQTDLRHRKRPTPREQRAKSALKIFFLSTEVAASSGKGGERNLSIQVLSASFLFNSFWLCDSFPFLPRCSFRCRLFPQLAVRALLSLSSCYLTSLCKPQTTGSTPQVFCFLVIFGLLSLGPCLQTLVLLKYNGKRPLLILAPIYLRYRYRNGLLKDRRDAQVVGVARCTAACFDTSTPKFLTRRPSGAACRRLAGTEVEASALHQPARPRPSGPPRAVPAPAGFYPPQH